MPGSSRQEVRPFGDFLRDINHGAVADQASAELAELVTQVLATGRKGSLVLTIQIEPFKGSSSALQARAGTVLKAPKQDAHAGVFFPDMAGNLHRNDPHQPSFEDLREEDRKAGEGELRG